MYRRVIVAGRAFRGVFVEPETHAAVMAQAQKDLVP